MENYELWLTDDSGRRLELLQEIAFLNYTRAIGSLGTISFGIPFQSFGKRIVPWFRPDWRVEVWRSPQRGGQMLSEDVFLLRKPTVYTRSTDGVQILQFHGRNGLDLLQRRFVIQRGGTQWSSKTTYADDMMKEIVREQMLYGSALDEDGVVSNARAWPQDEFEVQENLGLGPSLTLSFEGKRVADVLKTIENMTYQKNEDNETNLRVFYDVIPMRYSNNKSPLGWMFLTKTGIFGTDRTTGIEFSLENENIKEPEYSINHLEEVNTVYVYGGGRGATQIIEEVTDSNRVNASRWNRCEGTLSASNQKTTVGLQDAGSASLEKNKPQESLPLVFMNTAGGPNTPRSLYRLDWDLGDLVRVNYANKQFNAEISIIYVSVDENGNEEITGRKEVSNA